MKFVINKNDFRNILSKIQGVTGRKTNLAITGTVLIQTTDGGIKVIASDLETGFEGFYPAEVESEGKIAVNAKKLYEIVRDFPTDKIHVDEVENRWVEIGNDNIEYHIVGMNPDDFPENPKIENVDFIETDVVSFKRMIERVVFISGAADDKRVHITGVYFETISDKNNKLLRMVSTDGSRLSIVDSPCENLKPEFESEVLIPKKGLQEVLRYLDSKGNIKIGLKDSHFVIQKDTEIVTIRILEGDFPKYQDIIVKGGDHDIRLDRLLLLMMLKRMSILASDKFRGVVLNFEKNRLIISATNPELGESKEEIGIDYDGDSMEAAFNPKFFIEILSF